MEEVPVPGQSLVSAAFEEGYRMALRHALEYAREADRRLPESPLKGIVPEALELITSQLQKLMERGT